VYRLLFLFTASRPRHQEDQRDIKRLQQELRRKDKALAEAAALLLRGLQGKREGHCRAQGCLQAAPRHGWKERNATIQ
jgi:hypothetical protein